jgi:hypothetical protein
MALAVLFPHDNAPHRAARVHQVFDNNFEVVPLALYSPGLAPSEFLAVSNAERHSSWSHIFKSFCSCNSNFPLGTTNPKEAFAAL